MRALGVVKASVKQIYEDLKNKNINVLDLKLR